MDTRRRQDIVCAWSWMVLLWVLTAATLMRADEPAKDPSSYFQMSLEELVDTPYGLVEGPSKYKQEVGRAPATVTVITADEIRLYGYRNLPEILNSVTGLFVTYDRNYYYLGVRGFRRPGDYDTRILLLINGFRITENISDVASLGWECPIDVDLIERVEVIQGPGSSLYGSNALLATINVTTKSGAGLKGLEVLGEVSDNKGGRGRVTWGQTFNGDRSVLVSASGYTTEGARLYYPEFDTPPTDGWVENDGTHVRNAFGQVSIGALSLTAAHTTYDKGVPTAAWDTVFGDDRTRTQDARTLVGVSYSRSLSQTTLVKGHLAYSQFDYEGWYASDYADEGDPPSLVVNRDRWRGRWSEAEVQVVTSALPRQTVAAGLEGQYNFNQDQTNWDEVVYLDDHRHSTNWGSYIQDEFALSSRWTLVAGLRHDQYEAFGGTTNPRFALIGRVLDRTTLKFLYGRAFRAPNPYELYYDDGGNSMKGAQELQPERIKTYELALEQSLRKNLSATFSLFSYRIEDLIEQYLDPSDDLLVFRNAGGIEARGFEAGLAGVWPGGLRVRTGYSFVDATDQESDQTVVDSPHHLVKLNVIAPLAPKHVFAGLGLRYTSQAKTLDGQWAHDFLIADLWLTCRDLAPGLEIGVGVKNLFDTAYAYPGSEEHTQDILSQDGRFITGRVVYRFK